MNGAWICIKIGTAACRGIVHVAQWMVAAYMAVHPLPPPCDRANCHFVIPPAEFVPGGMFAPGAPLASSSPIAESPSPDWGGGSIGPIAEGLPQGSNFFSQGPGWTAGGSPLGPTGGDTGSPPNLGDQPPVVTAPPGGGSKPGGEPIPEPPTLALLGVGLLVLGAVRRRRTPRSQ